MAFERTEVQSRCVKLHHALQFLFHYIVAFSPPFYSL